jgi:murein L,D-transpeptidase YcbB/YkuD
VIYRASRIVFPFLFLAVSAVGANPTVDVPTMKTIVEDAIHPDLYWQDFSDLEEQTMTFYTAREWKPAWMRDGRVTSQARQIAAFMATVDDRGLHAADYDAQAWPGLMNAIDRGSLGDPTALARFDVGFTVSTMRCVSDLDLGRVNPKEFTFRVDVDEKRHDLPRYIALLTTDDDLDSTLAEIEPEVAVYERTRQALVRYRGLVETFDQKELPSDRVVKPGEPYAATADLARLLAAVGDLGADRIQAVSGQVYGSELAEAVKHYQYRHGLDQDGVMGPATFIELNTPLSSRVQQLQFTLERIRWIPPGLEPPLIAVNVPAFRLRVLESEEGQARPVLDMNVIVGKTYHKTPVFAERMRYVEFAPYWNVPYSITSKELYPKIAKDPGYVEAQDMEIVRDFGPNAKPLEPTPDNIAALKTGHLHLRQRPGPNNALGLVKFIFPNSHNVYLHSTPAQHLFSRSKRAFSHGCIRVEDPIGLAEYVLREEEGWTRERIEQAMNGEAPTRVILREPLWVYIIYASSLVDYEGTTHFWNDIYGHDQTLAETLAMGYPYAR